jgi:hypothetical protein
VVKCLPSNWEALSFPSSSAHPSKKANIYCSLFLLVEVMALPFWEHGLHAGWGVSTRVLALSCWRRTGQTDRTGVTQSCYKGLRVMFLALASLLWPQERSVCLLTSPSLPKMSHR